MQTDCVTVPNTISVEASSCLLLQGTQFCSLGDCHGHFSHVSLIDWISNTLSQGYTNLQSSSRVCSPFPTARTACIHLTRLCSAHKHSLKGTVIAAE